MPGSFQNFDATVSQLIETLNPERFLDIGCGSGKYGKMACKHAPSCHRIGIEPEQGYIEQFGLKDIYHEVRHGYAWPVLSKDSSEFFDLCIIGDCIEHMPKSAGLDLLNFLTYRTQYTVVLAPEFSVQGSVNGVDSESHVSVWSERDFAWHDRWAWDNCLTISMFVLRGYQATRTDFNSLINRINVSQVPVKDFYGQKTVRAAAFKKVIHQREEVYEGALRGYRPG